MRRLETIRGRAARRPWLGLAATTVAIFFMSFALVHGSSNARKAAADSDVWIYELAGDAIVQHRQMPYRYLQLEYPPGALPTDPH